MQTKCHFQYTKQHIQNIKQHILNAASPYSCHRNVAKRPPSTGACPRGCLPSRCVWPPHLHTGYWYRYFEPCFEGLSLMHVFWSPETQDRQRIQSSATEVTTITNDCLCSWINNLCAATSDHYSNWKEWLPVEHKPSLIEPLISPLPNHFPSAIIQQKGADSHLPRSTPNVSEHDCGH